MGYASYMLPDGRAAGYAVEAKCDFNGCMREIDRGLGYLCGANPDGFKDADESGCGEYFCGDHEHRHDCPAPDCGYSGDELYYCSLVAGHDLPHVDDMGKPHDD